MVVITIIFGNFLNISSGEVPYPVFTYVAILPWTLFSGSITAAFPSIIDNMALVTKIYFPREILPLSAIFSRLVDFAIAALVYLALMIYYQIPVYSTIIYLPILLIIQLILATGIGLLGAAMSVFLRDISFAIPLVMQIWMYATPIIYPISKVPETWLPIYLLNPMAGIIVAYRQILLHGETPNLAYLGISVVLSTLLCVIGFVYFKRLEMAMADIV